MKAKLTAEIVLASRRTYRAKMGTVPTLARAAGVTDGAMYCALAGDESWSHVPEALGWGFGGRKRRKLGPRT